MKKVVVALALAAGAAAVVSPVGASAAPDHATAGPYSYRLECNRAENSARQAGSVIVQSCYARWPQSWYFHYAR